MILVIGATGYIGRYLCTWMKEKGYDILALGRSAKVQKFFEQEGVPFEYFDLNDPHCFERFEGKDIDAIINLSACLAEHETPVEDFFNVNTLGVYKVLEFARKQRIDKVVVTSSHKVYNDIHGIDVISENDGISFTGDHSPYIISKIAAENFIEYYNKDFGMKAVALRLTGVHGYGEILGHLNKDGSYKKSTFEIFFENALEGKDIEVWGDQSVKRDHVYVKDVLRAIECAINSKDASGIFNIASGVGYSQYDEACVVAEVFANDKVSNIICKPENPGLTRGYVYSIDKAKEELGWEPAYADLKTAYLDYKKEWESKKYHNYHFILESDKPATL